MARPLISIPIQTVDGATGQPVEERAAGQMFMLPAAEGKCEACASEHEPELPHNAQSLFYQMRFNIEHGRAPNWIDAMEHCTPEMRATWTAALVDAGVDVAGGKVSADRKRR